MTTTSMRPLLADRRSEPRRAYRCLSRTGIRDPQHACCATTVGPSRCSPPVKRPVDGLAPTRPAVPAVPVVPVQVTLARSRRGVPEAWARPRTAMPFAMAKPVPRPVRSRSPVAATCEFAIAVPPLCTLTVALAASWSGAADSSLALADAALTRADSSLKAWGGPPVSPGWFAARGHQRERESPPRRSGRRPTAAPESAATTPDACIGRHWESGAIPRTALPRVLAVALGTGTRSTARQVVRVHHGGRQRRRIDRDVVDRAREKEAPGLVRPAG